MHLNRYHQQPPIPPTERRPGTVPSTSFNTWYVKCPEGLLQLLMPYLATSRIRKLYYKDTPRRRPQMIRAEWLAWVQNAPWVVQALMVQVWLHTHTVLGDAARHSKCWKVCLRSQYPLPEAAVHLSRPACLCLVWHVDTCTGSCDCPGVRSLEHQS